jgi:hypothetical protein
MRININEITIKIRLISETERKHENILGNASITLKEEDGGYFTISGFTIWKSKDFKGLNITEPQKPGFKYVLFEPNTGRRIKAEIIKAYEMEKIPVIE